MRYLIIGLGIYGANLARDLVAQGHEVIGADSNRVTVDAIKDYITTAYVIDTSEESALGVLPLRNVDVVIVAIGENFGASVKTVALLKKLGVKNIYARAIDPLHEAILASFNVARILRPEQRAALELTHEMALGRDVEALQISKDDYVLKFKAPHFFVGLTYGSVNLAHNYGLQLVMVTRPVERDNIMGVRHTAHESLDITRSDETVLEQDIWVVCGTLRAYRTMYKRIN